MGVRTRDSATLLLLQARLNVVNVMKQNFVTATFGVFTDGGRT
jgi:hypothetical protein